MDNKKPLMNNITATYKRCKEENIGLSLNHLRYICKKGIIPTCRIGNKHLVNWDVLMEYLKTGDKREESAEETPVISVKRSDRAYKRPIRALG